MLSANLVHIMACIDEARARGATRVELRADAHERYMRHLWRRADGTVFKSRVCAGSNSYYIDGHGDASVPQPHTPWWRVLRGYRRGTRDYAFATLSDNDARSLVVARGAA